MRDAEYDGHAGRSAGRRLVTLSVIGLTAVIVVVLVAAYLAAALVLGPRSVGLASGGNGAPCAINTPHATVARGDGIVAIAFAWFVRGTAGSTQTPYDASATPLEAGVRETICILRASDGALIANYDIGATGISVMQGPGNLMAMAPDSSEIYLAASMPSVQSTRLCALSALVGTILWCQQFSGYIEQAAVDDTALYLLANGTLEALDPATGQARWQQNGFDYDQLQPIVLDGGRIFDFFSDGVAARDELCAWSARDGSQVWCQRMPFDRLIFQFSVGGGCATAIARLTGSLLVREWRASDGQPLWQQRLTGLGDPQQTLNAAGGVYLSVANASASLDYLLLALNAATGAREWTLDTHTVPLAMVAGGSGFVADDSGTVLGYLPPSPSSSAHIWRTTVTQGGGGADFIASPAVYYTVGSTTVGALRLSDGKPLWEATNCSDGGESTPAHDANGATRWCHWPDADTGFEVAAESGQAVG